MDSSAIGKEWEVACGQQWRTVGAPANRAKHDLLSRYKLNKCFLFFLRLGALPSNLPVLNHGEWVSGWSLCLYQASMFLPKPNRTFSACGLTVAVCSLWPNLQLCQHVQKVVSRCWSAVADSTAVHYGCCWLISMSISWPQICTYEGEIENCSKQNSSY